MPKLQIELPEGFLSLPDLFPADRAAYWLEIGFGGGEQLSVQAKAHPSVGFIGCEPFINGVARLLTDIDQENLSNIRLFTDDARLLMDRLDEAVISRAFVLFPDPWPKKRHADRRFINRENLDTLSRIMRDGAELRFASDEMGYIRWTLKQVRGHPDFEWTAETVKDWKGRPDDWPPTRYEGKALAAGRSCIYLRFRRRIRTNVERCG
ncbi:MAG: tRNA (guanine(46)-N(7))-methyltransferase TrmB [Pseudomonadota bacterium]|nr:tRNA (guanine(46)-N(7))-methyltransferase TrmB [Pseudomonadota bacterium]